jgi:hypothetical protein
MCERNKQACEGTVHCERTAREITVRVREKNRRVRVYVSSLSFPGSRTGAKVNGTAGKRVVMVNKVLLTKVASDLK